MVGAIVDIVVASNIWVKSSLKGKKSFQTKQGLKQRNLY